MKKILIALIIFPAITSAQKKTAVKFTNITEAGILTGKSQSVFNVRTINGIAFKQSSLGIGVGLDNYGFKTIPVFIDARRKLGNGNTRLLLYANAGLNIPLRNDALPEKWNNGTTAYTLYKTFYGEAGIGINNKIHKHISWNLTVGYSYKHFSYTEYTPLWYAMPYYYSSGNATYDYYYRRLAARFGLQF